MAKQVSFKGAMSKVPAKVWDKARETPAGGGGGFEVPDIQDGTYPAEVTAARCGMTQGNEPYVSFTLTVIDDETYDGVKLDKYHSIKDMEKDLPRVVKTIKGMGYDLDENFNPEDLEDLVAQIAKEKPKVLAAVKNGEYQSTKTGETVHKVDVYVNQPYDGKVAAPKAKAAAKSAKAAKPAPAKPATKRK